MATLSAINLIVTEQLYSSLGNLLCTTIPVVKGSDSILGFVDTLISVRNSLDSNTPWATGGPFDTDSDVVNWAWANNSAISETDRQYAYQGNFPEADPLLRKMQSSQAGQVFSIDGETGSANHSTNYTAGYLPSGMESTLPAPLIDEDNTTSLYTELICNGSEVSLGDLGNHYRACVRDFEGKILAKAQVNESGEILLSTSLYQIGAALSSQSSQPYIKSTSTFLPDYYASSDTSQSITDIGLAGRNRYAAEYTRSFVGDLDAPGTVVLAGNAHYDNALGADALHTLWGQTDRSRVFDLTTAGFEDGPDNLAPVAPLTNVVDISNTTERSFCGACDIL